MLFRGFLFLTVCTAIPAFAEHSGSIFGRRAETVGLVSTRTGAWGETGEVTGSFSDGAVRGEFKVSVPSDASVANPKGVLLYLHGDGAGDFSSYWNDLKKIAAAKGLTAVAVKSPPTTDPSCADVKQTRDRKIIPGHCWWTDAARNARFLDAFLGNLKDTYGWDKTQTLMTGASGGSTFLGSYFIPKFGKDWEGGALLACPGWLNTIEGGLPSGPENRNDFQVKIVSSQGDFLKRAHGRGADALARSYSALYPTTYDTSSRGAHCVYNQSITQLIAGQADKLFSRRIFAPDDSGVSPQFYVSTQVSRASASFAPSVPLAPPVQRAPVISAPPAPATPAVSAPSVNRLPVRTVAGQKSTSVPTSPPVPVRFSGEIWNYHGFVGARASVVKGLRVPSWAVGYYVGPRGEVSFAYAPRSRRTASAKEKAPAVSREG